MPSHTLRHVLLLGALACTGVQSALAQPSPVPVPGSVAPRYAIPPTTTTQGGKVVVKSVDGKGHVTYSDRILNPAHTVKQFELKSTGEARKIAEASDDSKAAKDAKDTKPARDPKASADEVTRKFVTEENAKIKKENCDASRQNLAVLERGGRIVAVNDKGEPGYMTDDQITARREKVRADVERYCR